MNTSYLFGEPKPMILWRRLLWVWAAFWLMMLALGIEESLWTGTLQIRRPLVNTGSSALAATLLIAAHIRRADWRDSLLNQPVRWFIRSWASMPLQMIAYIAAMYGLRFRHLRTRWGQIPAWSMGRSAGLRSDQFHHVLCVVQRNPFRRSVLSSMD